MCLKGTSTVITNWHYSNLLEIKSKFQFFKLISGNKVLVYQKVRYECHLFSLLNFLHGAILNVYDVTLSPILLRSNFLLYATIWATV